MHRPKARIKMLKTWMKHGVSLSLVLVGAALAQDTTPLKLTLKDAVALALKQNPQVILASLQVSQSQQDRFLARSELLPQASGNLSETVNRLNLHICTFAHLHINLKAFISTRAIRSGNRDIKQTKKNPHLGPVMDHLRNGHPDHVFFCDRKINFFPVFHRPGVLQVYIRRF